MKIWRALPRWHLRVRKLHTFNSENFGNPRAFPPPPRKNLTSLRGHLRVKKMHAFCFQNYGNPRAFPLPPARGTCVSENCIHFLSNILAIQFGERYRGGTCVSKNCIHFISNFFAIPRPFHPPRKSLASATAGAPACQKLHTSRFQNFGSPPALPPTQ